MFFGCYLVGMENGDSFGSKASKMAAVCGCLCSQVRKTDSEALSSYHQKSTIVKNYWMQFFEKWIWKISSDKITKFWTGLTWKLVTFSSASKSLQNTRSNNPSVIIPSIQIYIYISKTFQKGINNYFWSQNKFITNNFNSNICRTALLKNLDCN